VIVVKSVSHSVQLITGPLEVCGDVAVAAASNDNTLLLLLLPEGL
jgi:hypothetical protein